MEITFAPLLPWPVLAGLGLGLAIVLALLLRAGSRGIVLRAAAGALLLVALADPTLVTERRERLNDIALLVVDRSASQEIADRARQTDAAAQAMRAALQAQGNLDVREVVVPPGDGTELFRSVETSLGDVAPERLAGMVIISDGQVHDVPSAEALAARTRTELKGPVHTLLTGAPDERDRRLVVDEAPSYGMVGTSMTLLVRVIDEGGPAPGLADRAIVTLVQDGGAPVRQSVPLDRPTPVPFTLSHGGATVLEVSVEAGPGELTLENNRAVVSVSGVRDRLRVLLVSGEPHPGERAWRNLLKADPSVDLVHFTILRPPDKQDGTPINELSLIAFPTRELFELKLNDFDLVVFDRYNRRGILPLSYLNYVAQYVEAGGAVLVAESPSDDRNLSLHDTPLSVVLPANPNGNDIQGGYRPQVTDTGRRHPVSAGLEGAGAAGQQPTWGRWFRTIPSTVSTGEVLMTGMDEQPLLVLSRVGEGRVAQLMTDHAWLWQRGLEGGGPQAELMRRLAHWLMKEPDLEEEDLRMRADGNRLVIDRRSLSPEQPLLTLTAPDGTTREITLADAGNGMSQSTQVVDRPGLYRVTDGTRTAVAAVGPLNPREMADVRASAGPMAPVAEATGGGVAWLRDGMPTLRRVAPDRTAAGDGWIGLRDNRAYRVTGLDSVPLLPPLALLLLALGALIGGWTREGR
ncbi:hypothetical protein [Zavarzinia sp. CC-PAN008]|uniref:hypothetical protein n=1 Tax=Zavarzinia sp. CC-PAN008 TaxID=3243332 RepID=UPI003F749D6F